MVTYKQIQSSNSLLTSSTIPRVSLFAGGTSGIGKYTLRALVSASVGHDPIRVYLVGRESSRPATEEFISSLRLINPNAEIVFLPGEISLLSETKRVCSVVKSREQSLDLLFLSAGFAPFGNARTETAEGLEVAQSLEYYSRVLFVELLLPLLSRAGGRVVSVLGGGLERPGSIPDVDDLDLKGSGGKGFMGYKAQTQYVAMNTLGMEVLARENRAVTFLHSWPGIVSTGNVWRGVQDKNSALGWFIWLVVEPLLRLIGRSEQECGERYLFQCTSGYYGGSAEKTTAWNGKRGESTKGTDEQEGAGHGLFLVNYKCDCTPNEANMKALREKAQKKVWDHTMQVLGPYM
ncbi:hypothetical protein QBC42DRAFT_220027 [Cladorrhinum samala]|uniref:NAD(P)-binding protein n=1 Tax=Cladorrhinum samala TaxID=585594 RepID=A0AAV9HXF9_9PEZI|nr:hypothetical protein QBC42DRAFT_220027 [Cladorrhinum samala]